MGPCVNTYKHPAMLHFYTGWKCPNYSAPILSHFDTLQYFHDILQLLSNLACPEICAALLVPPHLRKRSTRDLEEIKGKPPHIAPRTWKGHPMKLQTKDIRRENRLTRIAWAHEGGPDISKEVQLPSTFPFLDVFDSVDVGRCHKWREHFFLNCAALAEASFSHGWHFSEWRSNARSAWCGTMWPQSTRAGI